MAKISIFLSTNVVSLIHFPLFLTYISFFVPNKNIDFCRETEDKTQGVACLVQQVTKTPVDLNFLIRKMGTHTILRCMGEISVTCQSRWYPQKLQ